MLGGLSAAVFVSLWYFFLRVDVYKRQDKEAVKAERELTKNRNHLIAAARNGDEEAMESLTMEDMDCLLYTSRCV